VGAFSAASLLDVSLRGKVGAGSASSTGMFALRRTFSPAKGVPRGRRGPKDGGRVQALPQSLLAARPARRLGRAGEETTAPYQKTGSVYGLSLMKEATAGCPALPPAENRGSRRGQGPPKPGGTGSRSWVRRTRRMRLRGLGGMAGAWAADLGCRRRRSGRFKWLKTVDAPAGRFSWKTGTPGRRGRRLASALRLRRTRGEGRGPSPGRCGLRCPEPDGFARGRRVPEMVDRRSRRTAWRWSSSRRRTRPTSCSSPWRPCAAWCDAARDMQTCLSMRWSPARERPRAAGPRRLTDVVALVARLRKAGDPVVAGFRACLSPGTCGWWTRPNWT